MHCLETLKHLNSPVTEAEAREFLDPPFPILPEVDVVSLLTPDERDAIINGRVQRGVHASWGNLRTSPDRAPIVGGGRALIRPVSNAVAIARHVDDPSA